MRLVVLTPETHLFDAPVTKVVAEATNGAFALLERHVDMTAPLVVGVLVYEATDGVTGYFGIDEGLLVKCDDVVTVAVRRAFAGRDLDELRRLVARRFRAVDDREAAIRGSLARLEAGVVRRMLDLEQLR
jgi:F-type H+-transporting ATPase subunit epsilon